MRDIVFASLNVTSFGRVERRVEIDRLLNSKTIDVCFLQETRLKDKPIENWKKYELIRNDSNVGTLVCVHRKFTTEVVHIHNLSAITCTAVKISGAYNRNLTVVSIYIPCLTNKKDLFKDLNSIWKATSDGPVIWGGDFNMGSPFQKCYIEKWFSDNAQLVTLVHPCKPTFRSGSKLDYFAVSTDINCANRRSIVSDVGLEHHMISIGVSLNFFAIKNKGRMAFKWRKTDWKAFAQNAELNLNTSVTEDRNITNEDIDLLVESLARDINVTIEKSVPKGLVGRGWRVDVPEEIDHWYKERRRLKAALRKIKGRWLLDLDRIEHIKRSIAAATKAIDQIIWKQRNDQLESRIANINNNVNKFKEIAALSGKRKSMGKISIANSAGAIVTEEVEQVGLLREFYDDLYAKRLPNCDVYEDVEETIYGLREIDFLTSFSKENTAVYPSSHRDVFTKCSHVKEMIKSIAPKISTGDDQIPNLVIRKLPLKLHTSSCNYL